MEIAFIGFGEAARAFTDSLQQRPNAPSFAAYDIRTDAEMVEAMQTRRVRRAEMPAAERPDIRRRPREEQCRRRDRHDARTDEAKVRALRQALDEL